MKINVVQWVLGVLLAAVLVLQFSGVTGCATPEQLEQFKRNANEATMAANAANDEVDRLQDEKFGLQNLLNDAQAELQKTKAEHEQMQSDLKTQLQNAQNEAEKERIRKLIADRDAAMAKAEKAASDLQAKVDEFTSKINEQMSVKDQALKVANDWNAKVQAAESVPEVIRATGTAVAPATGPAAPWVLLGSNLLAAILGGVYNGKRVATKITRPIESARNVALEAKVNADLGDTGPNYIVFDKAIAGAAHNATGVGKLISKSVQ